MKNTQFLRFSLLILIILIFCVLGQFLKFDIDYYRNLLSRFPLFLSAIIYISLYVLSTSFIWMGPGSVFRITGAILFGPYISTLFISIAEIIDATIIFFISRILGRDFVEHKFKLKPEQIDKIKVDSGPLWVFALRINPLVPFRPMDVGFGLSHIRYLQYVLPAYLASIFRIFWLQYILAGVGEAILKDPMVMYQFLMNNPFLVQYSLLFFLAVFLLTLLAIFFKFLKKNR